MSAAAAACHLERLTWRLECLDGAVPCELCPDAPSAQTTSADGSGAAARLRVGRTAHTEGMWCRLVPDGAARQSVSREHFEVVCASHGGPAHCELRNLSQGGTFLNGELITGHAQLHPGDVLGAGRVLSRCGGVRPAVHFRLVAALAADPAATLTDACAPRARTEALPGPTVPALPTAPALEDEEEWCLVCTGAARDPARPAPAVALPVRPPSGGGSAGVLRVGLSLQEPGFWEALVPDPGALDGVSPEHFELFTGAAPSGGILINLSEHGTLVNGELVHESHRLAQGDVVGLPRLGRAEGEAPVVEFRLLRGAAGRPQAALAAPPGSPRASWGASGALDSGASGACGPTGSAAGSSECAEAALPAASALLGFGSAGPLGSAAEPRRGAGRAAAWQAGAAAADSLDLARAAARRPEETGSPLGRAAPERPFALECTQSRGLLGRELERLPARLRVLEAGGCPPGLRLGRAVQPPAFWQALLPREDLRNTVSREHFELAPQGGELRLTNRSVFGTLVNNELVTGEVAVRDGDTIGVRATHFRDSIPTVLFRLSAAEGRRGSPAAASCLACGGSRCRGGCGRAAAGPAPVGGQWASVSFEVSADTARSAAAEAAGSACGGGSGPLPRPVPKQHGGGPLPFSGRPGSPGVAARGAGA